MSPPRFLLSTASLFPSVGFLLLVFLLLEGCQSTDVVPEGRRFTFGLSQHEDLLLGQSGGEGGVFLSQEEVIVGSGHR